MTSQLPSVVQNLALITLPKLFTLSITFGFGLLLVFCTPYTLNVCPERLTDVIMLLRFPSAIIFVNKKMTR